MHGLDAHWEAAKTAALHMDGFDLMLLIVVSYVAVTALVRLMLARRDRLVKKLHQQLEGQLRERSPTT